jgi:hypothetical protein
LGSTDGDTEPSAKAPRQAGKSTMFESNNRPDAVSGTMISQINRSLGVCFAPKSGSWENVALHFVKNGVCRTRHTALVAPSDEGSAESEARYLEIC